MENTKHLRAVIFTIDELKLLHEDLGDSIDKFRADLSFHKREKTAINIEEYESSLKLMESAFNKMDKVVSYLKND